MWTISLIQTYQNFTPYFAWFSCIFFCKTCIHASITKIINMIHTFSKNENKSLSCSFSLCASFFIYLFKRLIHTRLLFILVLIAKGCTEHWEKYRNFTWFPGEEILQKGTVSGKFPHQGIRWNYGTFLSGRSVTIIWFPRTKISTTDCSIYKITKNTKKPCFILNHHICFVEKCFGLPSP